MMKDLAAFATGLLLFVGIILACLGLAHRGSPAYLPEPFALVASYFAPLLSGIVCGSLAPRRPIGTLFALGIAATASFTALSFPSAENGFGIDLGRAAHMSWLLEAVLITMPLLVITGGIFGIGLHQTLRKG